MDPTTLSILAGVGLLVLLGLITSVLYGARRRVSAMERSDVDPQTRALNERALEEQWRLRRNNPRGLL